MHPVKKNQMISNQKGNLLEWRKKNRKSGSRGRYGTTEEDNNAPATTTEEIIGKAQEEDASSVTL